MKIKFDREMANAFASIGAGLGLAAIIHGIELKAERALEQSKANDVAIEYLFEKSRMLNDMIVDTDIKLAKLEKEFHNDEEEDKVDLFGNLR